MLRKRVLKSSSDLPKSSFGRGTIAFSIVRAKEVLTPLKSGSQIRISAFVHRSKPFVWMGENVPNLRLGGIKLHGWGICIHNASSGPYTFAYHAAAMDSTADLGVDVLRLERSFLDTNRRYRAFLVTKNRNNTSSQQAIKGLIFWFE